MVDPSENWDMINLIDFSAKTVEEVRPPLQVVKQDRWHPDLVVSSSRLSNMMDKKITCCERNK